MQSNAATKTEQRAAWKRLFGVMMLILHLDADADAEAYIEKMQALYADYLSQAAQPNCFLCESVSRR